MPHYYFHLHNHVGARDEEGQDLPDLAAAREEAIRGARDLMAEGIKQGEVELDDWIEVQDESGAQVLAVQFRDAVDVD